MFFVQWPNSCAIARWCSADWLRLCSRKDKVLESVSMALVIRSMMPDIFSFVSNPSVCRMLMKMCFTSLSGQLCCSSSSASYTISAMVS
uniref:Putative secreted protein n=1 Tax=Anopheles darlingi TaxID=43151 RepID=A0A2M4D7J0_ANODA